MAGAGCFYFLILVIVVFINRVRTDHGKPGKHWNLRISFSRPVKLWNLIVGP